MQNLMGALKNNNYAVSYFDKKQDAAEYLDKNIRGKTVGFGGSMTLLELDMHNLLAKHNTVYNPVIAFDKKEFDEATAAAAKALTAQIFLSSVNAIAETGELVNIDGLGNRVAATLYGHEKVYFIVGANKIEPTLEKAIWRARNIAGPRNAKRLGKKTPCAAKGNKCYDCSSPERICNGMVIHMKKMSGMEMEIVLVGEDMGL